MKGCLIFLGVFTLIVLVLGGGCIGYVGYQGKQMAEKMEAGRAQLNAVDAKFPFTPAPDAKLGADRFSRFVKIRSAMVAKTSKVYEDLKAIGKKEDAGFLAGIKQAFGAMKGMFAAMTDAPADLAGMLEQGEMSFAEYRWSTSRMHGTLIAAAKAGNAEAQALNTAFEDSLKEFEQGNHNDKGVKDVRAELAAAYPTFDPGELALILSMKDQLQAESPGFVVDLFALEGMQDG
ncbi:MAG: hypothetical protein JNL94_20165 [Planctomycetes bacterium]|nr:hypothetical protein [Planctomycetota bacterium]